MSNRFYNYIANKINQYFSLNHIKEGNRYHIQFEKEDQVRMLYDELKGFENSCEYLYKGEKADYRTFCLVINGIKVIVASTIDGTKPDYLTMLRNKVGSEDLAFKDTAIFFIHNTMLDSIIKGAISLQKEGLPFHVQSIIIDVKDQLKASRLSLVDKYVIEFDLNRKKREIFEDNSSIFQYEDTIMIINSDGIVKENFKNFGLFFDRELAEKNKNDAEKRLHENHSIFVIVDGIHKYGNPDMDLEKYFDEEGVELLKKPNWKDVDYKDVRNSMDNKENNKKVLELNEIRTLDDVVVWVKDEGESKAKSRIKNIIIYNRKKLENIMLEISFLEKLKRTNLTLGQSQEVSASTSGKKIEVEIRHEIDTVSFSYIKYEDKDLSNAKYEFKIVVIDCEESIFSKIKTSYNIYYKKKEKFILINTEQQIVINPDKQDIRIDKINVQNMDFELVNDNITLIIDNDMEADENTEFISFTVKYKNIIVPFSVRQEAEIIKPISGANIWKIKRETNESFRLIDSNHLIHGTKEYYTKEEFKNNLERESFIVSNGGLYFVENENLLVEEDIDIELGLKKAYLDLINYYRINELIPSLTVYDGELKKLSQNYVEKYFEAVNKIKENSYLENNAQRDLIKIGTIKKEYAEKEILLTPLHPLNVAYQIRLSEIIGTEVIKDEIQARLNSTYLLPYLCNNEGKIYKPIDQTHSPEWKYYVNYKLPRYKGSRNFVTKLFREKLEEFIDHFSYLFTLTNNSPIKINLINLGDCREILQGVFDFYTKELNSKKKIENLIPLEINIYEEKDTITDFERLAFYEEAKSVKEDFEVTLYTNDYSEEEMLDIYREKVHFFNKQQDADQYEYCHITFYEMNQFIEEKESNMQDISTGVSLSGLVSGVPSVFLGDTYRTGFGIKHLNGIEDNILLKLAIKLNSLVRVIKTGSPYENYKCITTVISEKNKMLLDKVYNTSNWVTFINPKVDLNFFKNDIVAKDLLIIHYSDQHTSSSGYDAITVTRKSKQYQLIIEEFLKKKNIERIEEHSGSLINCFNAINGDWLLRMISSNSQFPKEKLSIISSIKISLAYFYNPNIIWVPISLEELLRVSGGAGLNQSEGLFSVKNLGGKGAYSDDILLVGVEDKEDKLVVHFYPIEVKIGQNKENVIEKAKEQANKTRGLFEENLIIKLDDDRTFSKIFYKAFIAQQIIIGAEKMDLYNIWANQDWGKITNSNLRAKLLSTDYEISGILDDYIGRGAILSFKAGIHFNEAPPLDQGIQLVSLSENDGYANIISNIEKLKDKFINGHSDFATDKLLYNTYKPTQENVKEGVNNQHGEEDKVDKADFEVDIENNDVDTGNIHTNIKPKEPMQILFGHDVLHRDDIVWYPTDTTKTMHTNTGIIGTMGTGKTQFTKSLITQLHLNQKNNIDGTPIGILIFDYKGDYIKKDFVDATSAKVYNLFHLPYNPLALFLTESPKPLLPLHTANALKETISTAYNLGPKQEAMLRDLIMETYDRFGIFKGDSSTWTKEAPTISDVYNLYLDKDIPKGDSLYAALTNLVDFEIFEPNNKNTKPLFDIIDGVTVINLSGYDDGVQNLIVAITLDIFYNQMQSSGHSKIDGNCREIKKMILVDEADNFLNKDFKALRKILKEGREFGIGTILSTQFLSHFSTSDNDYANYILTWVIHNVSEISGKDVRFIFNTQTKGEEENIINKIKKLEKHYSIVGLGSAKQPLWIRDKAFWELISNI